MKAVFNKTFIRIMTVAIIAMLLSGILFMLRHQKIDFEQLAVNFQSAYVERDREMLQSLAHMKDVHIRYQHKEAPMDFLDWLNEQYENNGLALMILHNDSLYFWSHHAIPVVEEEIPDAAKGVIRLKNGWYSFRQTESGHFRYIIYSVVKYSYRYQNRFLTNRFHPRMGIQERYFFVSDKNQEGYAVYDSDGDYSLSLVPRREAGSSKSNRLMVIVSGLLAGISLVMLVYVPFRYFSRLFYRGRELISILGFVGFMALVRMLLFYTSQPAVFYSSELFSPSFYATSGLLPSLGDLFFNVMIFSVISFFLFSHLRSFAFKVPRGGLLKIVLSFGLFAIIFLFCYMVAFLIRSLVLNSNLNLDVNFIFNLDWYSLVGFLTIGFIFFSFYFLSLVICRVALNLLKSRGMLWWVYLFSFVILMLWQWAFLGPEPIQWLLFLSAILVFEMERRTNSPQGAFAALIMALFLFSVIGSYALNRNNKIKDLNQRRAFALQLASEQDPVAEFLFFEMEDALFNDHQLKNLVWLDPYNEAAVYRYLVHHYFYDYWTKYDLQVTICGPREQLIIKPSNLQVDCAWFFEDYIQSFGKPTISENLVYLDNNTGRNSYIVRIPIGELSSSMQQDDQAGHMPAYMLMLEFDSKFVERDIGFPELLIDERIDLGRDAVNYSHATYKNGVLINKFGSFQYSLSANVYQHGDRQFDDFVSDGYHHLAFHKDDATLILVSRPRETTLEQLAPFSYLFILFFILVVIFFLLTSRRVVSRMLMLNFKRRVQVAMIGIVSVSVLAIGAASAWFLISISENKNRSIISEKSYSVLAEMEFSLDMAGVFSFDEGMELFLSDLLLKQANIFFTDINLYNPDGRLLASSRPKIFEEGLVSERMNTLAFANLRNQKKNQYIHRERIGGLEYLSAYVPIRNPYQELMGYINLPYFAKQDEIRSEFSYFLVAFINIILLLLVVAIVLAIFISSFVTQPLQLIRENLSRVQLGKLNQKIDWPRDDEIGSLVNEYNRMIDELGASAELLARSERETAWREMARQVAHEIKNPLTPMRLSIQYLEKAWQEKAPDWDERLERFSKTMVEQIDNLSVIASEFSDFAKMPAGKNNKINLRSFIPDLIPFFDDQDKLTIRLELPLSDEPLWVNADKQQLLRVFNNLINNAVQSYPKGAEAIIDLSCNREVLLDQGKTYYRIDVKDYGCGIPDELKKNIFSPNFTTKTSGMGLGLSMVKSIIESAGGQVSFHSEEGQGSIFSFRLPAL